MTTHPVDVLEALLGHVDIVVIDHHLSAHGAVTVEEVIEFILATHPHLVATFHHA